VLAELSKVFLMKNTSVDSDAHGKTWKMFYKLSISACKKVIKYCFVQFNGSKPDSGVSYTS